MGKVVVEMSSDLFRKIVSHYNSYVQPHDLKANEDYTIKEVKIEDDFFKEDATHKELRSQANKAYKKLKEYEFKKRNK